MDKKITMFDAWHEKFHSIYFDCWHNLTNKGLKINFENFNEVRLFLKFKPKPRGKCLLLEVGCATGEFFRYIRVFHKDIEYYGIDISEAAIKRAKEKYPLSSFFVSDQDRPVSETVKMLEIKPSILFARDVVLHQPDPFKFFQDLIFIPSDLAIFRLRTRDKGDTVLDPNLSCQMHYGKWVPYIVLNIDEVINVIKESVIFESLYIIKNYVVLGGQNNRFLPKECYMPETGTAETAICIKKTKKQLKHPEIVIQIRKEGNLHLGIFDRKLAYISNKILNAILKR